MRGEHGQGGAHTTLAYCTTHFVACAAVAESEKLLFLKTVSVNYKLKLLPIEIELAECSKG
jgi:hypothetical protein